MRTHEVFGIQADVQPASYVDRRSLDDSLSTLIDRNQKHIAIRGASKCGKSWLRQKILHKPIVVQCRLDKRAEDIFIDALSQLGIRLEIETKNNTAFRGALSVAGELGIKLLAKMTGQAEAEVAKNWERTEKAVGHDVSDFRFVVDLIRASGQTLVIEDFHYLSIVERKKFAFDLKTLWDYKCLVVIIGVWSFDNMLLSLNPDLSGRIEELSVEWSLQDLKKILDTGGSHLNIIFPDNFKDKIAEVSFGSAGILQSLALTALDEMKITEGVPLFSRKLETLTQLDPLQAIENAALDYADQLNPLYQEFAKRVASGIRERRNSTGIYAHAIAVILEASDADLTQGLSASEIFRIAHQRQPRVKQGNLKTVLQKFEELQIDDQGRGLILAYNPQTEKITAVDRQLLLYRKYRTVAWPWEDLIREADADPASFDGA